MWSWNELKRRSEIWKEWLWFSMKKFFKVFMSYVIALLRLCMWTFLFFVSGLQRTLFVRSEVCGVDFKAMPLRCDLEDTDDKLAYIDKLCLENPDLIEVMDENDPLDIPDIDMDIHDEGEDE